MIQWAGMSGAAILAIAAGIALFSGRSSSNRASTSPIPPECENLSPSGGHLAGINYLEIVTGGAATGDRLPMIVSLHGLGYDYEAHIKWLNELNVRARIILPNAFFVRYSDPKKRTWWKSYSHSALKDASKNLARFVWLIQQCRPTIGKPVITGHSMGGYIALDFATQFPELISYSVPVAGDRGSALWDTEPKVPVYAVHGELDNSYASAYAYYKNMKDRGLPVQLISVPGGGHRIASANAAAWRDVLEHLVR